MREPFSEIIQNLSIAFWGPPGERVTQEQETSLCHAKRPSEPSVRFWP